MSFHIYLVKGAKSFIARNLAMSFLIEFSSIIEVEEVRFKENSSLLYKEKINNIKDYDLNQSIGNNIKMKDLSLLNIDFSISIKNLHGNLSINNKFDSNIFGNVSIDISKGKIEKDEINLFMDLISKKIIDREQLNKFFSRHKPFFSRAYVDVNEDGEDNPLDVPYEYGVTGHLFFIKLLKAAEYLSEDDDELSELLDKLKETDKNYFSSKLWNNEKIRNYAFRIANENKMIVEMGSFKLYTEDKEDLKKAYKNMVKNILSPILAKRPSLESDISQFSESIK